MADPMTAPPPGDAGGDYALGRSTGETRRLILQHEIYAPLTRQLLVAAGMTAGMRVLDLGTGAGINGGRGADSRDWRYSRGG